ncbi:GNAT family N-acetyltransferase [Candidatus Thorarchaeota archaeon]|jgi:ribosomal protein S18 acetylase RimI-like enzyme|nr:MAG: GNAT family N-acetyltransferase [Candidatus Thorarchaeota archaeon]
MAADGVKSKSDSSVHSYLIMKADAQKALELATEWWKEKEVPQYVTVRNLHRDEMEEFVDLYNRCFIASPDPFCPLTLEDAKKLDTEGIFVAVLWKELSGFIACFVEKDEGSVYGEITGIGVLPSRRRRGIATALIEKASEYFLEAGVEEVYCEVYEENRPSRLLITAYGFEQVGRREVPAESSEDSDGEETRMPGGKIMRHLGLRPRPGCKDCRDL